LVRAPEKLSSTLDYVLALSATAVAEMRALVFELRPDSLEQEGLNTALAKLADASRARSGAVVDLELDAEPALPLHCKENLYRIAQEALHNAARHGHAQNISLRLHQNGVGVMLEVRDDGIGFDPGSRFPGHYGLKTMHERALRIGGALEIEAQPMTGVVVRVRIPSAAA
jgi:signal transduction histidine kinase